MAGRRRMGRALEHGLERARAAIEGLEGLPRTGSSLLMSEPRHRLFLRLHAVPYARLQELAAMLGVSPGSAHYHLARMADAGFLEYHGRSSCAPKGFVPEEYADPIRTAADPIARAILCAASAMPGVSVGTLPGRTGATRQWVSAKLAAMAELGLVFAIRDGRTVRIYPGGLLEAMEEAMRGRSPEYQARLLETFVRDGLEPRLIRSTPDEMVVRVRVGREHGTWIVPTVPLTLRPGALNSLVAYADS